MLTKKHMFMDTGSRVRVRYRGYPREYPGEITRVGTATSDVRYCDGTVETCVPHSLIQIEPPVVHSETWAWWLWRVTVGRLWRTKKNTT